MTKKLTALAALVLLLLVQRPHAQTSGARIFFVDVGTGASTLIVSPSGKTLLVDGGPPGSGSKIISLLDTLGIATIDYTVLTHYHIDHMGGMIEVMNAGRVAGTAFDNGDDAGVQPPGTSTSSTSTRGTYLNYVAATGHAGITRQTVVPGTFIDLLGGMRATFMVAGGRFLSGGSVQITNQDLNSESISTLIEYNTFDYLVSGDMTGGGSTSTAKTPDVETYVAQMVGDVDVVQLDHHGSTTANNQAFLAALKAEVAFAQTGEDNTFGHPNRETANKYLNTPTTAGKTFAGTGVPPATGTGPVFYQNEASPSGDDRVTQQGYTGAAAGNAGQGTVLLATDGLTTYALSSFDDGGVRINPVQHTYAVDGVSPGITTDFKPTVVVQTTPQLPLASDPVTVTAAVNDRESSISSVTLAYSANGTAQTPIPMTLSGAVYQATIPAQPDGTRVDYAVTAAAGTQTTTFALGYFSGVTPILSLRAQNAKGEPVYSGYAARIQGTVTASGFSAGTNDDYVQDVTGAINVYRSTDTPTSFTSTVPGQLVEVLGRINFNGGRLRLDLTESVEKATSPYGIVVLSTNPAPAPAAVTIAGLSANLESFEGQFVAIAGAQIVSGTIPSTPQALDTFVTISDGTGTLSMKIDHDTDVEGFTPAATFTAIGIVQQDDYLRPFDSGYNLAPRSRVDLGAAASAPPPLLTIGDARVDAVSNVDGTPGADFVPDRLNQTVRLRGTVSSIDFRGGNGIEYYVQDATGGIDLFNTGTNFGPFAIGDTVEALGTVTQFFGLTELTVTSVSLVSHDAAPAPQVISLAQLLNGGGELFEGQLVRVDNVNVTSGSYPAAGSSVALTIADGTASAQIFVDSDTDIDGTATPPICTTLSITGPLGQHALAAPFDNSYQIVPRSLADIVVTGGSCPSLTAAPATVTFPGTNVGSVAIAPVTISNNGSSSLTLTTPFTITGTDATQFSVGAPGTTTLAANATTTVSVTFAPTTAGSKSATLNIGSSAGSTTVSLVGTATGGGGGGGRSPMVISQFRTRGTGQGNDEFIEVYNNSDNPVDISNWQILGSSNTAPTGNRATVPANVVLPGRAHYLFVNTAAYSGTVPGNQGYTTGISDNGGIALALPTTAASAVIDQVGVQTTGTAYREGTPLATQTTTNLDRGYQRNPGATAITLSDTDNNVTDFALVSPTTPHDIVLVASPTSVDFGSAAPGDTRSLSITIRNLLVTSVSSVAASLSGTDAGAFTITTPPSATINANNSTTLTVRFNPLDSGAKSASLTVTSSSGGSVVISLSGTATGGLVVSPPSVDFGTVTPGSAASSTVTISNTDATGVTLTPPFAITGANAADFGAGAPGTSFVAGNSSTTFDVVFQPSSPGLKNATVQVTTAGGATRSVALTGTGTCPAITVGGTVPNGLVSVIYAGMVTASGGDAPYTFTVSSGGVPPGLMLSTDGVLGGTPTTTGSFPFTVLATAANGCTGSAPFTVSVLPAPVLATVAPSPLAFGIVGSGTTTAATVTITNASASLISLTTPFTITGTDAARFSVGAPGATTLAPGASTTASVSFSPVAGGVRNATLTVQPAGGAPIAVPLTGTGSVATPVLISEFRTRGPAGGNDEFVEIYNNTDAPIDISGYTVRGSNSVGTNSVRATVPANIMLPARTHYLFVNTAAAGYSGTVPGNVQYGTGITDDGGVALADSHAAIVDQVGMSSSSLYKEGGILAPMTASTTDRSYMRKAGGTPDAFQDTDDNATDFVLTTLSDPQDLVLAVSPATLDFGSVVETTTHSMNLTIRNLLISSVELDPAGIAGPDAETFAAGSPVATTLPGGASTTLPVTFHPPTAGARSATLSVTSTSGGSATVALTGLAVADTSAPVLSLPADITMEATGATTPVSYTATADDPIDGSITPVCTPASGSAFPVGTTAVSCTATDPHGNGTTGGFSVTITDHTAPTLTLPANVTMEATAAATPVSFTASASDLVDGAVTPVCVPASGSGFAVGTTTVNCSASDTHANASSASFTVTVTDHTAPAITAPAGVTATATTPSGAVVTFTASASDLVDGVRPVTCAPASGSTFAIGATTVGCSASDTHANTLTQSFTVTVTTATAPGRMIADASIQSGNITRSVAFLVQERSTGADAGALVYLVRTSRAGPDALDTFASTQITNVSFFNVPGVSPGHQPPSGIDTVSFSGVGRWNNHSGYTFDAVAVDAGEPGRGRDTFTITIRDSSGQVVSTANATITDGNIQSLRIQ